MTRSAADNAKEGSSFEHTVIQGTAQPLQAVAQFKQRKHLDIVSNKSGIAGSFNENCPSRIDEMSNWVKRLRSAIRGAKSGVLWKETRVTDPQSAPMVIDQVVPMTIVFDFPTMAAVRVKCPPGMIAPPPEVLLELSSQVYSVILPLISYADRRLHQGVVDDDGWALLRNLKATMHKEGDALDFLESQRDALKCDTLSDYPTFRAGVAQLKSDWDKAVADGTVDPDETWSTKACCKFVATTLQHLFDTSLSDYVEDPHRTGPLLLGDTLKKASALYKVRVERLRKRKLDGTSTLLAQQHDDDDADDNAAALFASSSQPPRKRAAAQGPSHRSGDFSWIVPLMMPAMAAAAAQYQYGWAPPQQPYVPRPPFHAQAWPSHHHSGKGKGNGGGRGKGKGKGKGRGKGKGKGRYTNYLAATHDEQPAESSEMYYSHQAADDSWPDEAPGTWVDDSFGADY
jgi:hypothetical protein